MIKHLIFDFDGTISDSYPHIVAFYHDLAKKYNLKLNYNDEWILHKSLITVNTPFKEMGWEQTLSHEDFTAAYRDMQHRKWNQFRPFPDAVDLLKYASEKGIKNYIYTHSGKVVPEKILPSMGLDRYITFTLDAGMGFPKKPAPNALLFLMEKFDLNPDECMMIGDRPIDAKAGINAGMKGCLWDQYGIFENESVDLYVKKLSDVKKYL